MDKIKVSYLRLKSYQLTADKYIKDLGKERTKLTYCIERVKKSIQMGLGELQHKIEDLRTDHAATDEKGFLIINEGLKGNDRYVFKPEKEKALRSKVKDLLEEEVEVDTFICQDVPPGLTYDQVEDFRGIIIPENYEFKPII